MTAITATTTVAQCRDPVSCTIDDTVLVMSADGRTFYDLNRTATEIWELLERPRPVDELCAELARRYSIEPGACHDEVVHLLTRLHARELVRLLPPPGVPATTGGEP